ncbi:hypothetical protein H1O05_gp08 [Klebsiella phage Sweeny]|uniref:Uncharacterized protein n=1 Tax=Klebsiella phage Sweeny TaxID=2580408 RepID=A0A5B9N564_9CAUD|nr:hypothetical protein H1O05_gp08 [Klebsiella phage Sweeny]QEG07113.1 hypothetical protein CPT_Sweeny_008 [Klebsiella phage Sweeny]
MKSCEYVNTLNGLIYWLEDGAVMMRKDGVNIASQSNMTAETFFEMVGNDMMKLIEVVPKDKGMTMLQFTEFLSKIDKSATTATAQTAIQGGATHIAIDGNGDVFAFKMRPRHYLPKDDDANDYLGECLRGSEQYGHIARTVCFMGNTGREHTNWRELCYRIPRQ